MILEIAYKIIAINLHIRLPSIEGHLDHESQRGFRPGRGVRTPFYDENSFKKENRS